MECDETNIRQTPVEKSEVEKHDSADNFQKFIYELFDKNGILNDLRAYLRGHIVNVLNSAQTGDPPLCQKHFTQRLELVSQALNMLVAEYLMQLNFTYTLSVFVSEIPLSNMIFDFAKTLLKDSITVTNLRFKDCDVWSVLNYIGVKCDSEHASNIVEMYKSEDRVPLLLCILKCMPMYHKDGIGMDEVNSSRDSLTSSTSFDTVEKKSKAHRNMSCHQNCKHYNFCKSCQNRISKLKEKYRERKKDIHKETGKPSENPLNVENLMKNMSSMEKRIINEMFEQLHTVYEAEVELVRQEEETRVRRTLASHALELKQRREELEQSLKTKEAELENNTQHKKQFLWGVARALREQHEHVTRAMTLVRDQQESLTQKENNLKTQLSQAEETLRKKGEEMRIQISNELQILEGHLESMRRERDSLNKERSDLENLKSICDSTTKIIEARGESEKEDLKKHYNVLKDEIAVLKKYIASHKEAPKCVIERSTITEFVEVPSNASILNNTCSLERNSRCDITDRETRPPNQLVNDLKKQKNVNFSQLNLDGLYREESRERSPDSVFSEEAIGASERERVRERDTIQRLVEENESLKDYARQQREHITALWCSRARSAVPRPRTAPALLPAANYFTVHRVNPSSSVNTFGWRKGAGEELSLFPREPPAPLPGDPIPFVGILRDRHADNRRHLINQWRALKRRSSPLGGVNKLRPPVVPVPIQRDKEQRGMPASMESPANIFPYIRISDDAERKQHTTDIRPNIDQQEAPTMSKAKAREKSPKTLLKEAKENLRNNSSVKEKAPLQKRDKSPNSMLREAKLRLRKLEIEAEAVQKSYLDFRKRQAELREERKSLSMLQDDLDTDAVKNLDISRSRSFQKTNNNNETDATVPVKETNNSIKADFDKYVRDYQIKLDIGGIHFKNKNTSRDKAKPIPTAYSEVNPKKDKIKNVDYLATPMMEFRKLYHAEKKRNLPQLKPDIGVKSGVAKIYEHDKTVDIDNINSTNVINNEIEVPKGNATSLESQSVNNAIEIMNKIFDEINMDQNINNETSEPKIPKVFTDIDAKKTENEKISYAEDAIEFTSLETLGKIKSNKEVELEILKDNIKKLYNFKSPRSDVSPVEGTPDNMSPHAHLDYADKNVLRVEVESSYEVNRVKMSESDDGELVIVVQSTMNTREFEESEEEAIESMPMKIDISPKHGTGSKTWEMDKIETPKSTRSESPEKAAQLTRNDVLNAIFHAEEKEVSSVDMHLKLSEDVKEDLSVHEKDSYGDYPDDFSADVDNYNSQSECGNNSPISLPKSSENENFWDN